MATAPPTINALPAPPDPNDRSTFNTRAYPWSVAQQTLATEANALAANVYINAQDASASASMATTKAAEAAASAATADTKAQEADASAASAAASATLAGNRAADALTSANSASSSASAAITKAGEAATSASQSATSATAATTRAAEAATSASTATTKASEASISASGAATSASTANTKAGEAAASATNAASSASAASTAATTATTKAGEASTSASNAATSAGTATTKAGEALASEVAAELAKDNAVAAAGAIGPIKFYDTKAQADASIGTMANGDIIEVAIDETSAGARTRYKVQAGALVFVVNLDQVRLDLAQTTGIQMVGGLNTFAIYPSQNVLGYGRNWFDVQVPDVADFIDNVFSVQNKSSNGTIYGNAAIAFLDKAGTERGAVGYSRNSAIQPEGYYPDTVYVEIGNPFTTDGQSSHFRVINTIKAGGPYWGGAEKSYFPIEVRSDTGAVSIDNGGGGAPFLVKAPAIVENILAVGDLSLAKPASFSVAMTSAATRMREYGITESFSIITNVSNDDSVAITKDNANKSAWKTSFGPGYDKFQVSRCAPAATTWTDYLNILDDGKVLVNQTTTGDGADGKFSVTSNGGIATATFRQPDNNFAGIFYNQQNGSDNLLVAFATDQVYAQRGSITYNRAGGLVSYNTTSDYRAKDIFGEFSASGEVIDRLRVHLGQMHGARQARPMFVAHEVQEVAPYAVTGEKDAMDSDGNPVLQAMDASALIPLMLAEIKSLRIRIAVLESA